MAKNYLTLFVLIFIFCQTFKTPANASKEYNRYLAHLFRKYGNGASITFEGLEHLMYNLGLGQLEFELNHSVDEHHSQSQHSNNDHQLMKFMQERTIRLLLNETNDFLLSVGTPPAVEHEKGQKTTQKTPITGQKTDDIWWEFKELHDPQHRHPRANAHSSKTEAIIESETNVCLSPKSLLRLVVDHDDLHKNKMYTTIVDSSVNHNFENEYNNFINNVKLTPTAFLKICPALVAQLDEQVCMRRADAFQNQPKETQIWNAWLYSSCSIFILSVCGLLGVLLIPLTKSVAYEQVLTFLIAVAVGTLTGDALMHLLPHALKHATTSATAGGHDHENEVKTVYICSCAFFTAVFMYIIENLLPLLRGSCMGHAHTVHSHTHAHAHSHQVPPPIVVDELKSTDNNIMLNETEKDLKTGSRPLSPLAFMVIIGDGLHNITDGLAVGAAFATDPVTGMATAVAILAHELPHELGDFALLLQTGVSMKRAVCLNLVSSVLSFVGMAIGLLITSMHEDMTQWIYAATSGSFLYIALADLVPAMAATADRNIKIILLQITGFITGGLIMLTIALNEDYLELLFK